MDKLEKKMLNTNDGWEEIVNRNAAKKSIRRSTAVVRAKERKLNRLLFSTGFWSVAVLVFVILGAAGAMSCWLASTASIISLMYAGFSFGQYIGTSEN